MVVKSPAVEVGNTLARSLTEGATLPAAWYTDADWYEREQRRIFRRAWQFVGLAEDVATPGVYFTCDVAGVPLIVVRDNSEVLHAFVNVCRHRASQIVRDEFGTAKAFQCPYHAWTYGLDGRLRSAPKMREELDFHPGEFSLFEARVETWGPFVFATLDPEAAPLTSVLGELPALVEATGLDLGAIKRRVRIVYDIAANWKAVVDNYLECYHCPVAHPSFAQLIDLDAYTIREYDLFSTQTGAAKADGESIYDTSGGIRDGFYAYLWPNFTLNIYPGPGNVSVNHFQPLAPDRTRAIYDYCFADEVGEAEEREFVAFIEQVQLEDIVLVESVQRGLATGYYQQGRLMRRQEQAVAHFQRLVQRALA